ncbi:hypothetical protein KAJ77_03340 [bacterium]|nr:hypothetical protein [bacterium]
MMFGEEKLAELSKAYPQQAIEALSAGDVDKVITLLNKMMVGQAGVDLLVLHTHFLMADYILNDKGAEALEEMMGRVAKLLVAPYVKLYREDEKKALEEIISLYRNQLGAQLSPLKEDADEIQYLLAPCGSGGNPINQMIYAEGKGLDKNGIPLVCRACKTWQQAFNDEVGAQVWEMAPESSVPCACRMTLRKQAGKGADLFSKEELWLNSKPTARQALERVMMQDFDIAELIKDQRKEWTPWHDFSVRWLEYVFAWVAETYGLDYYDDFMSKTYDHKFQTFYPVFGALPDEERVAGVAAVWNYHVADFHLTEDENNVYFHLDPCGSGGRLYRSEMHLDSFEYGTELAPLTTEEHPIGFNRKGLGFYCTHCASSNRDIMKNPLAPLFFMIDGESQSEPGASCVHTMVKRDAPQQVDERLLKQVGITELVPRHNGDA